MSRARVSTMDLGPAFDEAPAGLNRRQLLRAGAWAAPVLLLATAAPAVAASGDTTPVTVPAFSDYLVWNTGVVAPALAANYNAIQQNFSTLRLSSNSTSAVTASLSLNMTPSIAGKPWVYDFNSPKAIALAPGGEANVQFQIHTASWDPIPAGTYTVTLTAIVTRGSETRTVLYQWSITKPQG